MNKETRKLKIKLFLLVLVEHHELIGVSAWTFPDPPIPSGHRPGPFPDHSDMPPSYNDGPPPYFDDGFGPPPPFHNRGVHDGPPRTYYEYNNMRQSPYYYRPSPYDDEINTHTPRNNEIGLEPPYSGQTATSTIPPPSASYLTALDVDVNGVDAASMSLNDEINSKPPVSVKQSYHGQVGSSTLKSPSTTKLTAVQVDVNGVDAAVRSVNNEINSSKPSMAVKPSYNGHVAATSTTIPPSSPTKLTGVQVNTNAVDPVPRSPGPNPFFPSAINRMDNPLLDAESYLPKFSRIWNHHITPALEEKIGTMKTEFELFESCLNKSFATTTTNHGGQLPYLLDEFDRIKHTLDHTWSIVSHLHAVKNDNELRQIYELNQINVLKAMSLFPQSKPLYDELQKQLQEHLKSSKTESLKIALSKGIKENGTMVPVKSIITDEIFVQQQEQRAAESILRSMKEGGVGMKSKQDQERLNEIQIRLASLANKFSNNILDETTSKFSTVHDPAMLYGVPESVLLQWNNAHRKEMVRQGYSGGSDGRTNANDGFGGGWSSNGPVGYEEQQYQDEIRTFGWKLGPWRITMDQSSYISAMKHIPNRDLRKQIYMAHVQRASEISQDYNKNNIPVIEEILKLKTEMANLLGYDNYAELSLSSKMASSTHYITKLTDLLAEKALPAAKKELEEITKFAHASGGMAEMDAATGIRYPVPLEHWDIPYWTERLKESKFDFTEEELRPYFAHPNVLDGLFQLVYRLFDVTIKEGLADIWHPDVSFYNLYDTDGKHIASFYLDPYFRPLNKRGGAWMSSCVAKSRALKNDLPVAYVSYNVNPPERGKPSLLTFREVETVFHEFGHALQHLLTTASVGAVSGINGIEWDAVEIPSQFMERWCYDRDTLYSFARHWQTRATLPESMYKKLLEQKVFGAGMKTCQQLYYGQLDLALHGNKAYFDDDGKSSIFDVQRQVAEKYLPLSPLPEDRYLCSFSHIFAGGYSAGYYSYLWADLMSADAFGAFAELSPEKLKETGKRFRDTFLSLGGGIPPDQVFEIFRGRSPTPKALLEQSGLQ